MLMLLQQAATVATAGLAVLAALAVLVASVAKAVSATLKQHIFPAMLVIIVAI